MSTGTKTAAAVAVDRLGVGGFNSRSLEEALAAPRRWDDAHTLIVQSDSLIVELWHGPQGDRLVKFEDQSYIYFYGCTGGARHLDTPMILAFAMPHIEKELGDWRLVFSHDRNENGGTIRFCGSRRAESDVEVLDGDGNTKPDTVNDPILGSGGILTN